MTDEDVDRVARASGFRLAQELDSRELVDAVEKELAARHAFERTDYYFDPIELGSLIVSVANLSWVVYAGLRRSPDRHGIAKEVDRQLADDGPDPETRRHVITVVVDELLAERDRDGSGSTTDRADN